MFIRIIACFDHFSQSESKTKFFNKIIVKIKYGILTILETSLTLNCVLLIIIVKFYPIVTYSIYLLVCCCFFENLIHLDIRFCDIKT